MNTYILSDHIPVHLYPDAGSYSVLEGVSEEDMKEILKNETVLGRGHGKVVTWFSNPSIGLLLSYKLDVGIPSKNSQKAKDIHTAILLVASPLTPVPEKVRPFESQNIPELAANTQFEYCVLDMSVG